MHFRSAGFPHKPPSRINRFGRVAPSAWGEELYCHLSIHILTSQRSSPPHTPRHNSTHEQPKHGKRTYNGITPTRSLKRSHPSHKHGNARKTDLLPLLLAHRKPALPHGKTAPLVRNGEAVSAYDASSTPHTSDISHTPNRARPLCQIRQPKSCECDAQHRFVAPRLRRHRNPHKRTRISDNPLKFARNMCFLSDCPQFNRFKLQHTTQNTPSPDARAHSTATAAPATRLNSSTHREHPASSHPNTAFASNQSHLRTNQSIMPSLPLDIF